LVVVLDLRGFRGDRIEDVLAAFSLLLGLRTLHLWLRPISQRVRQSAEERRLVRKLVRSHGQDSLAFFSLRRDKSYFFSPTRRSFLAYKVVGGAALVSGDPIGAAHEFRDLLAEFRRVCHARGWRLALLSVRAELLPITRELVLRAIKIGDEAVVRPAGFSLGAMRRDPDTPDGLMEYLIVQLLLWARAREAEEISLNFCVFADLLANTPRNRLHAAARTALRAGDRLFQLERLLVFSRKF